MTCSQQKYMTTAALQKILYHWSQRDVEPVMRIFQRCSDRHCVIHDAFELLSHDWLYRACTWGSAERRSSISTATFALVMPRAMVCDRRSEKP